MVSNEVEARRVLSWEEALAFGVLAERRDRLREQGNESVAERLQSVRPEPPARDETED